MKAKSKTDEFDDPLPNYKAPVWYYRVSDVRVDFEKRVAEISRKSAPAIAERLLSAYCEKVLQLYESLPPETRVISGLTMWRHCADRQNEVRQIKQILAYLIPNTEVQAQGGPPAGSILHALPPSARPSATKGRPATRRLSAVQALQLQIDTARTWSSIAQEVCDCPKKKKHDLSCAENIRQSVIGLKRLLRKLGIQLPQGPRTKVE